MVDGDALEMRFGETQRGFESPPLRLISSQTVGYFSCDCDRNEIYFVCMNFDPFKKSRVKFGCYFPYLSKKGIFKHIL